MDWSLNCILGSNPALSFWKLWALWVLFLSRYYTIALLYCSPAAAIFYYSRGPQPLGHSPPLGLGPFETGLQTWRVSICAGTPFLQAVDVCACCLHKWSYACACLPLMWNHPLPPSTHPPMSPQSWKCWGILHYRTLVHIQNLPHGSLN